jgi:hypothetical protein
MEKLFVDNTIVINAPAAQALSYKMVGKDQSYKEDTVQ